MLLAIPTAIAIAIGNFLFTLILQVVLIFSAIILWTAHTFLQFVLSGLLLSFSYTKGGLVDIGWPIMRDFANLGFVFALVVIALATALRYKDYEAKKILVPLIGVILLINFTPVICGLVLDLPTMLMNFFVGNISGMTDMVKVVTDIWNNLVAMFTDTNIASIITGRFDIMVKTMMMISFNFLTSICFLLFGLVFTLRFIVLWILVIISPLAFFAYVLPSTRQLFTTWWNMFIHWAVIGLSGAFMLFLADQFLVLVSRPGFIPPVTTDVQILQPLVSFLSQIFTYFLVDLFMIFAFFAALSSGGVSATAIINTAKSWGGQAVSWAGAKVGNKIKTTAGQAFDEGKRSILTSKAVDGSLNNWAKGNNPLLRYVGREGLVYRQGLTEKISTRAMNDQIKKLGAAKNFPALATMYKDAKMPQDKIAVIRALSELLGGQGIEQMAEAGLDPKCYDETLASAAQLKDMESVRIISENNPMLAENPNFWKHMPQPQIGSASDPGRRALAAILKDPHYDPTGFRTADNAIRAWQLKQGGKPHNTLLADRYEKFMSERFLDKAMRAVNSKEKIEQLDPALAGNKKFAKAAARNFTQQQFNWTYDAWGSDMANPIKDEALAMGSYRLGQAKAEHWVKGIHNSSIRDRYDSTAPILDSDGNQLNKIVVDKNGATTFAPATVGSLTSDEGNQYLRYTQGGDLPKWAIGAVSPFPPGSSGGSSTGGITPSGGGSGGSGGGQTPSSGGSGTSGGGTRRTRSSRGATPSTTGPASGATTVSPPSVGTTGTSSAPSPQMLRQQIIDLNSQIQNTNQPFQEGEFSQAKEQLVRLRDRYEQSGGDMNAIPPLTATTFTRGSLPTGANPPTANQLRELNNLGWNQPTQVRHMTEETAAAIIANKTPAPPITRPTATPAPRPVAPSPQPATPPVPATSSTSPGPLPDIDHATQCFLNGQPLPVKAYMNPVSHLPTVLRMPGAPPITYVSPNGRRFQLREGVGDADPGGGHYEIGGRTYRLEQNRFVPYEPSRRT